MSRSLTKVSVAIRILQRDRDVSARASHLVKRVISLQAEMGKFLISTVLERNIMSTKTTFKRVALVVAAAVTFGGVTAVASHATGPTLSGTAGSNGNTTVTAVVGSYVAESITASSSDSYYTIKNDGVGSILYPAASTLNSSTLTTQSSTTTIWSNGAGVIGGTTGIWSNTSLNFSVYSATAGTQTITVTGSSSAAQTITITWGAAQSFSAGLSTAYLYKNDTTRAAAAAADDTVSVDKGTYGSLVAAGVIAVTVNGNDGQPYNKGTVSATVSGPGLISVDTTNTVALGNTSTWGYGNSVTASGGVAYVHIQSAGVAGVATVTVTVTDAAGVATVLATKTVTFTGALAAINATGNLSVLKAGATNYSGAYTAAGAKTVANTSPITALITDANGNKVASGNNSYTIKSVSSDATVLTGGNCTASTASPVSAGWTAASTANTTGEYNCPVSGTALAASGKSATITVTAVKSDGTVVATAAPVTFTIGGAIKTAALSTDAASYSPLSPITLSYTAKDSSGNAAYDQDLATFDTGLSSSIQLTGIAADGSTQPTKIKGGVGTVTGIFAPASEYTGIVIKGTDAGLNDVSATFDVGAGAATTAANAAIDAANEATDAANAATDAATNAMDSADAAQQAAMDAGDKADAALAAITDLASKVQSFITSITAQISALAAAVAKIKAKVKA